MAFCCSSSVEERGRRVNPRVRHTEGVHRTIAPPEVSDVTTELHQRKRVVHLAVIAAMVEGDVAATVAAAVKRIARTIPDVALDAPSPVDYDGFLSNSAFVSRARRKRLAPDVLMSYFVRPGTALCVGYTDILTPLDDAGAFGAGDPTTLSDRRFFTKLSYLLRF
jgi:hypothetical protein